MPHSVFSMFIVCSNLLRLWLYFNNRKGSNEVMDIYRTHINITGLSGQNYLRSLKTHYQNYLFIFKTNCILIS